MSKKIDKALKRLKDKTNRCDLDYEESIEHVRKLFKLTTEECWTLDFWYRNNL